MLLTNTDINRRVRYGDEDFVIEGEEICFF